jgi:hypothetical protein
MHQEDEPVFLIAKPIDLDDPLAYNMTTVIAEHGVAPTIDLIARICEKAATRRGDPATLKGEKRMEQKQWDFASRELERVTQRILEYGPGSGCR